MRRSTICRHALAALAALAFALLACADLRADTPLTQEQALAKITEWGPEGTARRIVVLDTILKATPTVSLPEELDLLDGRDLVVSHQPGYIALDVGPWIHYRIALPDRRVADFAPAPAPRGLSPVWLVVATGAGIVFGAWLTHGFR